MSEDKFTHVLKVRVSPAMLEKLTARADKERTSVSQEARAAIEIYLALFETKITDWSTNQNPRQDN
jgi:hypothetical protein